MSHRSISPSHLTVAAATLALCAGVACAGVSSAERLLFSNGPFITAAGAGFNGADVSQTQTGTVPSFTISNTTGSSGVPTRVIDNFMVPAGAEWKLTKVRFWGTQTQNSGTESTTFAFQSAVARVTLGDPRSALVWAIVGGDFTTNRLLTGSSGFVNVYRAGSSGSLLVRNRPIFAIDADLSDLQPINGASAAPFYIEFATVGDPTRAALASTFPVTPLPANPDGSQFFNGTYQVQPNQLLEVPFELWGVARCGKSDVAGANQAIGFDGTLTADDIIVFLGWFFANDSRADVGGANQATEPDSTLTADDIIVFLGRFFAGC